MSEAQSDDLVRLAWFSRMGTTIAGSVGLRQTIQHVMEHIGEAFAPTSWSMLLRERRTGDLQFVYVNAESERALMGKRIPRGHGIAGWVAHHGQSVIVEDTERDNRFSPEWDELIGFHTRSVVAVPLRSGNRVFGVIELVNAATERTFTPLDLRTLEAIAAFAAVAIEKMYYLRSVRRLSNTDPVTGLLNRRTFERVLNREAARSLRSGRPVALLMWDIDHFKSINDTYGHVEGDRALALVATVARDNVRTTDIVCRIGGDEFAAILPDTETPLATRIAERMASALAVESRRRPYTLSVSVGVVSEVACCVDEIISQADRAMYAEKGRRAPEPPSIDEDDLSDYLAEDDAEGTARR